MKPAGKKPKKGKAPAKPADGGGGLRPLLAVALTLAVTVVTLWGLGWLGDEARRKIANQGRYTVNFADVKCDPPPGSTREAFLAEVRYAANLPETFQVLDAELKDKFAAAFATHPWVEAVEDVAVDPPETVRVKLRFRTPFLVVHVQGGGVRAVDAGGVLLPESATPPGLVEAFTLPPPTAPAGKVWANDDVRRAVELAKAYPLRRLDRTPKGWRLTRTDGAVLVVGDR